MWTEEDFKKANLLMVAQNLNMEDIIDGINYGIDKLDKETLEDWLIRLRKPLENIKIYLCICYLEEKLGMDDTFYSIMSDVMTALNKLPPKHKEILKEWLKNPTRDNIKTLLK